MTAPTPDINGILRAHMAVERYRDELEVSLAAMIADRDASSRMHEETRVLLDQALTERDQLRETIAAAPHAQHCSSLIPVPDPPRYPCNCWKKEVDA